MVIIALKFASSKGVGYSVLACKMVIFFLLILPPVNTFRASSISFKFDIPVESIIWLSSFEISLRYGKFVISPLGILVVFMFSSCSNLMLSISNGVDKKSIPNWRQCPISSK